MDDAIATLTNELVVANHILFHQGVVDGFGHVSARHPARPEHFLMARSMAPALVQAHDILELDQDGEPVVAGGPAVYLERFIHSEIYRVRPDVMGVVHSHSPSVVPFSVVPSMTLRPLAHTCGFLGTHTPIFEIRECVGGDSDLLVRDRPLGAALARSLGAGCAVLMRGHGSTVVAGSLRLAVHHAVYTELAAQLQSQALRLGPVTYLTAGEAAATTETNDKHVDRAWALWQQLAEQNRLDGQKV